MTVTGGDVLRVDVLGLHNETNLVVNSYQFKAVGGTPISDADALDDLADFLATLYNIIKIIHTALVTWNSIRVRNVTTGLLVGEIGFGEAIAGTSTGDQGAAQVAALISFKTNVPRVNMRKYFPVSETFVDNTGTLTSGAVAALTNFGVTLLDGVTGNSGMGYEFGYLSPKAAAFVLPQSAAISAVAATQRRRRPGVGA